MGSDVISVVLSEDSAAAALRSSAEVEVVGSVGAAEGMGSDILV